MKSAVFTHFFYEFLFMIAGVTVSMVAARHARYYPAGNEILGNKVNRPGDTKDNLDAMLLEEIHRTRPHATCNDMGYVMRCKEWR